MDFISTTNLIIVLVILIACSGFFSSSETAMMSLNRYRLRHLAKTQHRGARLAQKLLNRPDRLIGLILIGNNFVNLLASAIATVVAVRLWGDLGIVISTAILTFVILVFAEVTPKTLAALHPEKVAFPVSFILAPLLKVFYPAVWLVNLFANAILKTIGVHPDDSGSDHLSTEELRTVVNEAGAMIPQRHQKMLLSILDLENVSVEDIMIPRNEIVGIDLEDPIEQILQQLRNTQHTRLPVYESDIDKIKGFLHARNLVSIFDADEPSISTIISALTPVYFVPEGTPLNTQLLNFQRKKQRIGLVVDEYGEIQGLVTIEDILEEIVGEFTTNFAAITKDAHQQEDGTFLVEGGANIRELNRSLNWHLPIDGPKTLNGLITEYLEAIPQAGTGLRLAGYPMEILQTKDNMVKSVKVWPDLARPEHRKNYES